MERSVGGKRCRASVRSNLILKPRAEQRLQGHDVFGHAVDGAVEDPLVQLRGGKRLVQTRPAPVPRLELSARQLRFDLQHVSSEEVEGLLVLFARTLEVKTDLEPAGACVVPGLVMELGTAEVHLHQAAAPAGAAERAERRRKPRFHPLAQPSEEVHRREDRPASQRAEYISYA